MVMLQIRVRVRFGFMVTLWIRVWFCLGLRDGSALGLGLVKGNTTD